MAQPILTHRVQIDRTAELQARLAAAPLAHAEAILSAYALLQDLHDHGALDLLRGLTAAGGDAAVKLSEAANTPESIAALRNTISLFRILSSIDPEVLHGIAEAITKTSQPETREFGLWRTVRRLGSKESLRALGAMAYGLQVFGRVLIARQSGKP